MSAEQVEDHMKMNDTTCPWCETDLVLRLAADEQTCPECGTTWSYEEQEEELALAA
jgi:ribosomal protein L37AE/L43A